MTITDETGLGIDSDRYVHQTVDGEVLVIDTAAGLYFSLRGAAARLWPLLAAGTTPNRLRAAAERAFAASQPDIRAAVDAIVERLRAEGIIRPTSVVEAEPSLVQGPLEPWAIERYEDMQDLLTLDPIHDVSDSGWPNVPR